jgi:hypothetical protein
LKDAAQGGGLGIESPIAEFPTFEQLEFKGQQNQEHLGPFLQAMKQLALSQANPEGFAWVGG